MADIVAKRFLAFERETLIQEKRQYHAGSGVIGGTPVELIAPSAWNCQASPQTNWREGDNEGFSDRCDWQCRIANSCRACTAGSPNHSHRAASRESAATRRGYR